MSAPIVVLVEDDDDHAELTEAALRRAGLGGRVLRARTAAGALELLGEGGRAGPDGAPRLVLLDLRLPDLDGRTVLARLRAGREAASLRVVVLTATHPDDLVVPEGADAVLSKPVRAGELAALAGRLGLAPTPAGSSGEGG